MKKALAIMALLVVAAMTMGSGCDDEYTYAGEYTDDRGVNRAVLVDRNDGALVTMPKVQVDRNATPGDCVKGAAIYNKTECK